MARMGPLGDLHDWVSGDEHDAASLVNDEALTAGPAVPRALHLERRSYAPGDCAWWEGDEAMFGVRGTRVVPCGEAHVLEVTGRHEVTDQTGGYPTVAYWEGLFTSGPCLALAETYLGAKLDPYGNFYANGVIPSPESWRAGDREVWCGIGVRSYDAERSERRSPAESTGPVRGSEQHRVYPVGSCLGEAGSGEDRGWGVVPCDAPHTAEVAGHVDLSRVSRRPTGDGWGRVVNADCQRLARSHVGGPLREPVQAGWLVIEAASWDAGRRTLECTVAEYQDQVPVTVTRRIGTGS